MNEFWVLLSANLFAPMRIIGVLSVSILLGVAGPFGTYLSLTFFERLLYWSSVVVVSMIFVQVIKVIIETRFSQLNYWTKALIVTSILTIVLAPILPIMSEEILGDKRESVTPLWLFALLTFSITMTVFLFRFLMGARTMRDRPRLFERFEDPKVKRVSRVTVRDHYVDVYTDLGVETLLMRFADAVAELDGIKGQQVHRSHWVANAAVAEFKKQKGRTTVVLNDGHEIPVSRGYLDAVEARFG